MSVVIVGGNDRMIRQYINLCRQYQCRAKVFTQMQSDLKNKIGQPDLLVLFTGTTSHKMIQSALCGIKGSNTVVQRCHSSSMSALKGILESHRQIDNYSCG